jgi:polyisoprenoid-binding protein YceI
MSVSIARATQCLVAALALVAASGVAVVSRAAPNAAPPPTPAAGPPPAGEYRIDKAHASLLMRASHLGFSNYTTRFSRFDSQLTFDPNNIPASTLVTTIDASSFEMDSAPQFCLDIMKGAQFLDVGKFPTIVYRSNAVRMTGPKSFEITGTLSLHGVTRPLTLTATYNGGYPGMPKMDPNARVGFSAHGSFRRSEFGMVDDLPAPGTTMGVGDLVDVSIEAEYNGPPLAAPEATH